MDLAHYFTDRNTYTTVLLTILMDEYGSEFMEWDPMSLALQIRDDFGIDLPGLINDRIQSGCILFTTNAFHTHFETFNAVCNSLSFDVMDHKQLVPADIEDCMWGCSEAKLLEGTDYDAEGFSQDIQNYVGYLLNTEGLYKPPSVLTFASYPGQVIETTQESLLDDDIMYGVFWEKQQDKKRELERYAQGKLSEMFIQLKNLPIKSIQKEKVENALKQLHETVTHS